ncbi:MAG: nitroreductase family protein [Oscillospiraceae bacterium]|nr:nitroreductase family protein [Oscillospiraceae bacterium]
MKNIAHRVSIRKYQNKPVEKEKVKAVLRAAMQAPSAGNQQPWEFYVVTNKEKLKALAQTSPYAQMTAQAPVAIVSAYRKDCMLPMYAEIDLSIAMENLWLETDAQGLGGVWLGIAPLEERMKAVEAVLDIPAHLRAFAIFPLGYPDEEREQENRYDESRIHYI